MHVYLHTYRYMLYIYVRGRSKQAKHQKNKKGICKTEVSNCRKVRRFLAFSHFSKNNFCKEFLQWKKVLFTLACAVCSVVSDSGDPMDHSLPGPAVLGLPMQESRGGCCVLLQIHPGTCLNASVPTHSFISSSGLWLYFMFISIFIAFSISISNRKYNEKDLKLQ